MVAFLGVMKWFDCAKIWLADRWYCANFLADCWYAPMFEHFTHGAPCFRTYNGLFL